ncbi:hypothetical protein ACU5AX_05840 [Sphingomonas sp. XXL09]|uniref:hypothetical protein n=1 Tax=Sphingomonas sp. XXL09 TaxID=3457787 RepID=UPI00406BD171
MDDSVFFAAAISALAFYGIWAIRRDLRRGVASARGFSLTKDAQPKRYRWLMTFNVLAVSLICIGAIIQLAQTIGKL